MTVEEALSLKVGDRILYKKTGKIFEVVKVIWDSRDPPEYVTKNVITGEDNDGGNGGEFWTWFANDDHILIRP